MTTAKCVDSNVVATGGAVVGIMVATDRFVTL